MATEADTQYEASDESSENELLDCSLSVWKGLGWNVKERFDPVPLDLHTASSIGQYDCVRDFISRYPQLLSTVMICLSGHICSRSIFQD